MWVAMQQKKKEKQGKTTKKNASPYFFTIALMFHIRRFICDENNRRHPKGLGFSVTANLVYFERGIFTV